MVLLNEINYEMHPVFNLLRSYTDLHDAGGLFLLYPDVHNGRVITYDYFPMYRAGWPYASVMAQDPEFLKVIFEKENLDKIRHGQNISGICKAPDYEPYVEIHYMALPVFNRSELHYIIASVDPEGDANAKYHELLSSLADQINYSNNLADKLIEYKAGNIRNIRLFESAPEGIAMLDKNNTILDINPEFERIFQYSRHELLGKKLDKLIAPGKYFEEAEHLTRINWDGGLVSMETQRMRRDKTLIDVSVLGVPVIENDGNTIIYGIYRDITEARKTQKQSHEHLGLIEFLTRLSSDLINIEINEIDAAINKALERVARVYHAERSYLAQVKTPGDHVEITHEWSADPLFSYRDRQPLIRFSEAPVYFNELKKGNTEVKHRTNLEKKPETESLAYHMDLFSIESMFSIPFRFNHQFKGYVCFDTYSKPVEWNDQALSSFKLAAQIIANALERKQNEQALKEALEKAEASDMLKSAFLASISHEVRTPMNHIMGFIELLNEPDLSTEERDEYLEIMKSSGTHLLRLIDNVIELAMLDSGQVSMSFQPLNLERFLGSLNIELEGIKTSLGRSNTSLKVVIPPELKNLSIITDELRLRQIIANLAANAIKFTPQGSVIIQVSFAENERLKFEIADTGIGIAPSDLPKIFEPFRQIEQGFSRKFGGAGLGLSICKGLVNLFGSEIEVNSEPGKGSVFSFSIPYVQNSAPPESTSDATVKMEKNIWSGKTILMAEDDPVSMRFLTVLFINSGANLIYASNGKEAIDMIAGNNVDIVLMDMQMPVLNGFEATRRIKELYPDLPVIAQTAFAMKEEKSGCYEAGCDDYITKPIDKASLFYKIDALLHRSKGTH